jgi:hypothetical protein
VLSHQHHTHDEGHVGKEIREVARYRTRTRTRGEILVMQQMEKIREVVKDDAHR